MAKYDNIPGCPGYYISKRGEECPRWVNKEIPELFDYYCDGVYYGISRDVQYEQIYDK